VRAPLLRLPLLLALAALAACGGDRPRDGAAGTTGADAFRAVQRETADAAGVAASFATEAGLRFELVPAGTQVMGSPREEPGRGGDETAHEVRIVLAYYVATTEVSKAAVAAWRGQPPPADGDAPATGLTHGDAEAFAAWLTTRDAKHAFRLPTEAEWEHAARAAGRSALAGLDTGPWEWCSDGYGPYPDWFVTNPQGDDHGSERVLRGGPGARVAQRMHRPPEAGDETTGVRLVAPLAYGKADEGRVTLAFESLEMDEEESVLARVPGLEVRIITVLDRLSSRQVGRDLPWQTIPVRRTPFRWRVPPGRYYAQCQVPGSEELRGVEIKIDADRPEVPVRLPTPREGSTLPKPQ
jgi:hypothetical protein